MKPEDLKLIELLQINEAAGTIYFKNRRMLIFDADAMGLLRRELIEGLGVPGARKILARFGYARGYRDAMTSKELFDWETLEDWWRAGTRLHALEGITDAHPLLHEFNTDTGTFYAEGIWTTSYEAEQHLRHIGKSDTPVCWTLTGYASGYTTAVFGREVFYFETECVGRGDGQCHVVGKSLGSESNEAIDAAREHYQIDDFEQQLPRIVSERAEIQELMGELDRRASDLEEERARVAALESQVFYLQEAINQNYNIEEMVGVSPTFKQVMKDVERVAPTDTTVLITGETGTGKELVARALYARSQRRSRPLITVNCAALPAGLVESELFGHERGAFTGAVQRKLGRFELANHATIFLDEVGELLLDTQAKFLRVLQQGEFERVGGTQTIKVDVRVIAATNQPLARLVEEGKFRSDLYYRLNVFPINIPPLRERGDDLVLLVNYFAQKFRARFKKKITSISQESLERLQQYAWPGNVRELEHIIERAVLLAEGEVLQIDLPLGDERRISATATVRPAGLRLVTLDEMEREYIEQVLKHTSGMIAGRGGAAEILGLPASTLRSRMKKLGVK
ncbi:MAG: sigma 54-interacting transcriptional regulator [Blastocatellia bacterium]